MFVCLIAFTTFSVLSHYVLHQFFSPSFFPPSPGVLTVNVEPGTKDATALVPSFLLAYMFTQDWDMET